MDTLWITYFILIYCFISQVFARSDMNGTGTVIGCDGYLCDIGIPSQLPLTSDKGKAVLIARCHAKCLETYGQALESSARRNHVLWPAIPLTRIKESTCLNITELEECRRGCIIRSSMSLNRGQCREKCKTDCEDHANATCNDIGRCNGALGFSECRIICSNKNGCRTGCLYTLPSVSGNLPVTPESGINITRQQREPRSNSPGIFDILPYEVPQDNTATQPLLTTFLIQLDTSSGSYYYLQDTITEGTLNLGYCACQAANISFAAVTSAGPSMFSTVTSICIHGGIRYPVLNPSSIQYTVQLDRRAMFESHVLINLSWDEPEEFHLVTNYVIKFRDVEHATHNCRSPYEIQPITIPSRLTRFQYAAYDSDEAPKINCKYIILIDVLPRREPNPIEITVDTHLNTFIAKINVTCSYDVDAITGLATVNANWYIEDKPDTLVLLKATSSYKVTSRKVIWDGNPDSTITGVAEDYPASIVDNTLNVSALYSYKLPNITPFKNNINWIRIEINPQLKTDATFRNLFSRVHCDVRPVPNEPSAINAESITVEEFTLGPTSPGYLNLTLTWNMPESPYGQIEQYQIRILRQNTSLGQNTSDENISPAAIATLPSEGQNSLQSYTIFRENVFVHEDTVCLYIQIRAKNMYMWGPWSDSAALVRFPDASPNCQLLPPKNPITQAKQSSNIGSGVGVGVAVIVALGIAIILVSACICLCRRHRMKVQMKKAFENGYSGPMYMASIRGSQDTNSLRMPLSLTYPTPDMDEWEIPVGAVIVESKFGEGCFGEVHRGVVRGPLPSTRTMKSNICVAVAIKMLKNSATGNERSDFIHEIETMKKVAQGNNPHVISFIGCATLQEPLCLITEFVKYGDLLSYLETIRKLVTHKNRQKRMAKLMADLSKEPEPYIEPQSQDQYEEFPISGAAAAVQVKPEFGKDIEGDKVIPTPGTLYAELGGVEPINLISFAYQIASGMEYLSGIDIVHRDLACRNILIGEHKTLKISDFGMSRVVTGEDIYVKTSKGRLPWKWMAIESIVNREFTHASDVWAYGVTLWEIATLGGFPYPAISNTDLLDYLKKGYRLECPDNCSQQIYSVMSECWNEYPEDRKTFSELRSLFDAMLAEDSPYIQFENINVHQSYYNVGSRRNTRCEDAIANLSSSEAEFESSTSTITLNGASVNGAGAYDNLIPLLPRDTPPSDLDDQGYPLHIANQYVDTPTTFKCLEQNEEEKDQSTEDDFTAQCGPKVLD